MKLTRVSTQKANMRLINKMHHPKEINDDEMNELKHLISICDIDEFYYYNNLFATTTICIPPYGFSCKLLRDSIFENHLYRHVGRGIAWYPIELPNTRLKETDLIKWSEYMNLLIRDKLLGEFSWCGLYEQYDMVKAKKSFVLVVVGGSTSKSDQLLFTSAGKLVIDVIDTLCSLTIESQDIRKEIIGLMIHAIKGLTPPPVNYIPPSERPRGWTSVIPEAGAQRSDPEEVFDVPINKFTRMKNGDIWYYSGTGKDPLYHPVIQGPLQDIKIYTPNENVIRPVQSSPRFNRTSLTTDEIMVTWECARIKSATMLQHEYNDITINDTSLLFVLKPLLVRISTVDFFCRHNSESDTFWIPVSQYIPI